MLKISKILVKYYVLTKCGCHRAYNHVKRCSILYMLIKDDVKSVLRILSARNKNNSRGATVGILIKLKP